MQLVTQGKRAPRYLDIGRKRLAALRSLKLKNATTSVGVPAGTIIAQVLGNLDRLIITVRNPYLLIDVLLRRGNPPKLVYIPTEGGVTSEPFEAAGYDALAVEAAEQFSGFTKYVTAGQHALAVNSLETGTITPFTYISKVNTETGQPSYIFGYNVLKPSNGESLPMVDIVTMGHIGEGTTNNTYCAFGAQLVDPAPTPSDPTAFVTKFPYVGIVRVNSNDIDISDQQYGIWPLSTLNSGRLDRLPQAMSLTSVGKDRVAWVQRYNYADPTHPDPIPQEYPEIVVYNALTGVHTRTVIRNVIGSGKADVDVFSEYAFLGYCGNGVILAALSYPDPAAPNAGNIILRSTNYGASWTVLTHKITDGFIGFEPTWFYNYKAFVSFAPGKIWLYTIKYSTQQVEMHYSEDYGVSWDILPIVAGAQTIQNGFSQMTAIYDKVKKGTVIGVTRYETIGDKDNVFIDVYENFTPNANKLYTTQIAAGVASESDFERAAVYFDRNAPMMPGYPGELGDNNVA